MDNNNNIIIHISHDTKQYNPNSIQCMDDQTNCWMGTCMHGLYNLNNLIILGNFNIMNKYIRIVVLNTQSLLYNLYI